jgi:acid stress-induced BolA-like protein IbaG/YrbA
MTPQDAEDVATLLEQSFVGGGVDLESVNGNGRYQFAIVSPQFSNMPQLDRQDAVWDAIRGKISQSVSIDILMILAFSPEELAEIQEPA